MSNRYKIIYLTGSPASGKSSLTKTLKKHFKSKIFIFEYGNELMRYLKNQKIGVSNYSELRNKSAKIVRAEDIHAVDLILLQFINSKKNKGHIIVDSHAVTKEIYGFRITAFSYQQLSLLPFTEIYVLYSETNIIQKRIKENPGGRPLVTNFETDMHTFLQASVAINYGIILSIPIYFFDSAESLENLSETIVNRMKK